MTVFQQKCLEKEVPLKITQRHCLGEWQPYSWPAGALRAFLTFLPGFIGAEWDKLQPLLEAPS